MESFVRFAYVMMSYSDFASWVQRRGDGDPLTLPDNLETEKDPESPGSPFSPSFLDWEQMIERGKKEALPTIAEALLSGGIMNLNYKEVINRMTECPKFTPTIFLNPKKKASRPMRKKKQTKSRGPTMRRYAADKDTSRG